MTKRSFALSILNLLLVPSLAFSYINPSSRPFDVSQLQRIIDDNSVNSIEDLIGFLPGEYRLNFVLKHGIKRNGERGHLIEEKVSQSSDPNLPRAILWDERSGFSISYNGGGEKQTAPHRLDILEFDQQKKVFSLSEIDFPIVNRRSPVTRDQSCKECHGASSRPIFSMYPDWPSFYGSDNDELNNASSLVQQKEITDYHAFRKNEAKTNSRYSPLYDVADIQQAYGLKVWDTFPYRQNTSATPEEISRSFSFRPGLRLGIIYNRMNAQAVFERISNHPNFQKYGLLALHSILQCNWNPKYPKTRAQILSTLKSDLKAEPIVKGEGSLQLDYNQLVSIFGLKVNDIDIRYSYNHKGYANKDASQSIMQIGYIGRYNNSYFDGSATADELIALSLIQKLSQTSVPAFRTLFTPRGLTEKYRKFGARFAFDRPFFEQVDRLGHWFPIPFPATVSARHHRETFTADFKREHQNICEASVVALKDQWIK